MYIDVCACVNTQKASTKHSQLQNSVHSEHGLLSAGSDGCHHFPDRLIETPDGVPVGPDCIASTDGEIARAFVVRSRDESNAAQEYLQGERLHASWSFQTCIAVSYKCCQ